MSATHNHIITDKSTLIPLTEEPGCNKKLAKKSLEGWMYSNICYFSQGKQLWRLPDKISLHQALSRNGSTLEGKNLTPEVQILSFMS